MKFAIYTNSVSAHQMPLANCISRTVGMKNFQYVYTNDALQGGAQEINVKEDWITHDDTSLESCETILVGGIRPIDLMERRMYNGLKTYYMSERWFKPPLGMFRLFHPEYFKMALRMVFLIRSCTSFMYLPIGIHAACDMARLCGLLSGDLQCLFCEPELDFERKPGGKIWLKNGGNGNKYCLDKMRMWGYYVEPSKIDFFPVLRQNKEGQKVIKLLWVGRYLNLKRVDTIIKAVKEHMKLKGKKPEIQDITLDIYGAGAEEKRLKAMANGYEELIKFYPPVPITEVRKLMREHDVYVLSSNGYEGWGAVVSEALEEGMKVIGTYEAGSSRTILPESCLFHVGDWWTLLKLLHSDIPKIGIGDWTANKAANWIVEESKKVI